MFAAVSPPTYTVASVPAKASGNDDLRRVRRHLREAALQLDEAALRPQPVREGGDAVRSDLEAEHGNGQRDEQPCRGHEAERRTLEHTLDDRVPEACLTIALRQRGAPDQGDAPLLIRSPRSPSNAGSNVSAATTDTIPTRIAPRARLRMMLFGTISMPSIATTKAVPLKNTARDA